MASVVPGTNRAEWHHIDAGGKVLGRIATQAASLLLAKHRIDSRRHLTAPVYVVITNTDQIVLTGNKETQKKYRHYTGYPGGLRERSASDQRRRDSRHLLEQAVSGMLPKNKLRRARLQHLKLYAGADHPHAAQLSHAV